MPEVLLLNPPFLPRFSRPQRSPAVTKSGTFYYPMWLAYATGALERAGIGASLVDAVADELTDEDVASRLEGHELRLIVLDTSTPSIANDADVGAQLKQRFPQAFVLLVGSHVSALPEETLQSRPEIDGVARGEYDCTVFEQGGTCGCESQGSAGIGYVNDVIRRG